MSDVPTHCTACKKHLPDGSGNQEIFSDTLLRFCDRCWKLRCEGEIPDPKPQTPEPASQA